MAVMVLILNAVLYLIALVMLSLNGLCPPLPR